MGIRMAGIGSGIDPKLIDQLVQVQKIPIENAKRRQDEVRGEKDEVQRLSETLGELETSLNNLKTRGDFYKLKVDSSHPDIIEGVVNSGNAIIGNYEFEVRGLAKSEKELAYGFPDPDQTAVGFGFMEIERENDEPLEVTIEPGSTLQDVANQINSADNGVKAMVVNTKFKPDPYRLLVISEKSGKESKITIDEDTTFLEFQEQVSGRNLDVLFEDVPVTDEDNTLDELLDGVVFTLKRSEPGTRVSVAINYDVDKTIEGIQDFVDKYNGVAEFISNQFKENEEGQMGRLAGDSSLRTILRGLQGAVVQPGNTSEKYNILADIGITTDPKTGRLNMDESKVRSALTEDYTSVATIFTRSKFGEGVAERLSERLRAFRDPASGVLKARLRGLDSIIRNQDRDIERRERQLVQQEETIRRRFSALDSQVADLNAQGDFLAARMGGGQAAPKQGGGN